MAGSERTVLRSWLGHYSCPAAKTGWGCDVAILNVADQYVGRIRTGGWQVNDDLLASLRVKDSTHLELVFQKHGPAAGMTNEYQRGDVLVTLVRHGGRTEVEWGALSAGPPPPPPARSIRELLSKPGPLGPYPWEFFAIPSFDKRLRALLQGDKTSFHEWSALQSPAVVTPAVIFMEGSMPHGGWQHAGAAYDRAHNEITAYVYEPECRERMEVWRENWQRVDPAVAEWLIEKNEGTLPVFEHRPARRLGGK